MRSLWVVNITCLKIRVRRKYLFVIVIPMDSLNAGLYTLPTLIKYKQTFIEIQ